MISAFVKAFEQLGDPRLRRFIFYSLLASLAVLVALVAAVSVLLSVFSLVGIDWIDTALSWLGGLASVVLALLLFPAVVVIVMSIFLDQVADAVEARHYPGLPKAPGQGTLAGVWTGIKFAGLLIGVNLLLLVVYLVLLATVVLSPLVPVVFYTVNGWLAGREYFETVAFRRLGEAAARELRRPFTVQLTLAGAAIAFLAVIPIVNLIAPVIATAVMVHLFQDFSRQRALAAAR
ncbi:MAG: EI24 domain-containing protein [Reyranellaceae bacterium]